MKNSTLLRLFFISIGLPLACASSSPSTSSTLTLKPDSLLVDTTNTAPAVQLKDQDILVQSVPEERQVSGRGGQTKKFEELISKRQYEEMAELGMRMSKEELLRCLCQVVTDLDHFKGLFGYLEQRKMVPDFLAHGDMALVRKVIVETGLPETDGFDWCDSVYDAIALSFKEDRHDRVAGLFEAAHGRPDWKDDFDLFVYGFFGRHSPEKDSMPLKRFLTLHGKEFSKQHPDAFEIICQELVWYLRFGVDSPVSQKLLIDLVGQPFLLTPTTCARGFLRIGLDAYRTNFIKYGYKEAIEEGLKEGYPAGDRKLWTVMVRVFPSQFSGEYPSTDKTRKTALKNFKPTKQDREEEWAKENAPILLKHLETLATELPIARVLLPIIAEYAITWVVV